MRPTKFVKQQMTNADLVAVVTFSAQANRVGEFHERSRDILKKAVARITARRRFANLPIPLYAAAQNGEYDVQQYTGAAYTADETEFNVFNTDQKLARRSRPRQRALCDSWPKVSDRIHGRHHANGRRKSHAN